MPKEINRPSASTIEAAGTPQTALPGVSTPEATSLGLTPLAIAAILALVLHVAAGVMLDRSHASQAGAALDEAIACVTEGGPPQPSLPYD